MKKKRGEIEDVLRGRQVQGFYDAAERQRREGDLAGAIRSIENGLRLAPDHTDLKRLEAQVRPLWERQEKSRRSNLSPIERLKEEGDEKYKNAQFEEAIRVYTRCLDQITDKSSDLALKVYANR